MQIEKIEDRVIKPYADVKLTRMGNISEIQYCQKKNSKQTILMLENKRYCICDTGEIKDCIKNETRATQEGSLRRTFKNIRNLINTNLVQVENARWITLTYAENMTDTKKLYEDFDKFKKRFNYYCQKNGYEKPSYITVVEPQERGAWHHHLLFIWKTKAPFIPNKLLRGIWGNGFVKIKQLNNVDNIGAYLTAYLADIPLNDQKQALNEEIKEVEITNDNGKKEIKKFIKGGRLKLYPVGMNIYRTSRDIKRPTEEYMSYKKALKKASAETPTFQKTIKVSDTDTKFLNIITTEYYNSNRK